MNRYPEYKESGVEWIGEIPKHWTLTRLKYISNIPVTYGLNIEADRYITEGIRLIRITDIGEGESLAQKGVYLPEDCVPQEQMLNSYDLLLSRSGATVGKSYLHLETGKYTSAGYLVRFNFDDYWTSKFIYYVTLSHFYRNWLEQQIIISTIQNVNGEKYSNFQLPIPLHQEQKQIVSFLDRKTERIDELIHIKERQIELLQEQRTALINQAVTKELDPNVEMKPSGVEWIGEIPKHWEVRKNKRIFHERDDRSGTGEEELLTVSHITGVSPRAEKKNVGMFLAETLEGYKHCSVGNLVINTMWAWMGALGVSSFDGIVSPSYNVYELKSSEYVPKYYDYLYRTPNHVNEIIRWSKGIWTSRWRLYPDAFFSMFAITPPFSEQAQIANFLNRKTEQIDELVAIEQRKIELLKEYRQSLISEAVTGKIDVRNEA